MSHVNKKGGASEKQALKAKPAAKVLDKRAKPDKVAVGEKAKNDSIKEDTVAAKPIKSGAVVGKASTGAITSVISLAREQIVVVDRFNPRINLNIDDLAKSIGSNGIKEALHGKYVGEVNGAASYELTDGHRRLAAYDKLGKKSISIPFIVEPVNYTEMERTLDLLLRNDSEPLNMLEEAEVFQRLCESHKLSQAYAAERTGRSKMHVSNCILLLTADQDTKAQISKGLIAASLVIEMLKKKDKEEVSKNVREAVAKKDGKKVTKQDVLPKKSATPATSQTNFDAAQSRKENKPVTEKKESNMLEKLDTLIEVLEDQPLERKKQAFDALKAVREYLAGRLKPTELVDYFFVQEVLA